MTANPLRSSSRSKQGDVLQVAVNSDNTDANKLLTEKPSKDAPQPTANRPKPVVGFVPQLPDFMKAKPKQKAKQPARTGPPAKVANASAHSDPRLSMDPEHTKPGVADNFLKGLERVLSRR